MEASTVRINDVNQGSGRGDLRYLVPQDGFDPGNCNYGNPACTTYLVLYSKWGGKSVSYNSDGGFEESSARWTGGQDVIRFSAAGSFLGQRHADALVHETEKQLKEHGDKVGAPEKEAIETALASLKDAMGKDDAAAIREDERRILAPSPALKRLQRRLLREYLETLPVHPAATAFRYASTASP